MGSSNKYQGAADAMAIASETIARLRGFMEAIRTSDSPANKYFAHCDRDDIEAGPMQIARSLARTALADAPDATTRHRALLADLERQRDEAWDGYRSLRKRHRALLASTKTFVCSQCGKNHSK